MQTTALYLDIDIHLAEDSSSPSNLQCYMIVCGISGTQSNVASEVFDTPYIIENTKILMAANLERNSHKILNNIHQLSTWLPRH